MNTLELRKKSRQKKGDLVHTFWIKRFSSFEGKLFSVKDAFNIFKTPFLSDITQIILTLFEKECVVEENKTFRKIKEYSDTDLTIPIDFIEKYASNTIYTGSIYSAINKSSSLKELLCTISNEQMWFEYIGAIDDTQIALNNSYSDYGNCGEQFLRGVCDG